MVRDRVRCATKCSGVDWFLMNILGGRESGAAGVSTLGGEAGLCTAECGGTGAGDPWEITLGAAGGFSLEAG